MLSKKKKTLISMGVVIGLVNGIFGGGGGIIAVTMLTGMLGYSQKKAHATSLAIILPISVISAVVYLIKGYFPLKSGSIITFGVALGGIVGAILLKKLKQNLIKAIFLLLMIFSGIKLLFL